MKAHSLLVVWLLMFFVGSCKFKEYEAVKFGVLDTPLKTGTKVQSRKIEKFLKVISFLPTGEIKGRQDIVIVFNQEVVDKDGEKGDGAYEKKLKFVKIVPEVSGKWSFPLPNVLKFTPFEDYARATKYTVFIRKDFSSVYKTHLEKDFSFFFRTGGMKVFGCFSDSMKTDQKIYCFFNCEVDLDKLKDFVEVKDRLGRKGFEVRGVDKVGLETFAHKFLKDGMDGSEIHGVVILSKFANDSFVRVKISRGLLCSGGNLGLDRDLEFNFSTYSSLKVVKIYDKTVDGRKKGIVIEFNNPVDRSAFNSRYIRIYPRVGVKRKVVFNKNIIEIYGNIKPNKKYKIFISRKVKDVYGQTLGTNFSARIKVGGLPPLLELNPEHEKLALLNSVDSVEVFSQGVLKVEVAVAKFEPREFLKKITSVENFSELKDAAKNEFKIFSFKPGGKKRKFTLRLGKIFKNLFGIYVVFVRGYVRDGVLFKKSVFAVSDRGIVVRESKGKYFVMLFSIKSGAAIPSGDVYLLSGDGEEISRCRTDEMGMCELKKPVSGDKKKYYFVAGKGDDFSFVASDQNFELTEGVLPFAQDGSIFKVFLFTDKSTYRINESVELSGVIREYKKGGFSVPLGEEVKVLIKNSKGVTVFEKRFLLTDEEEGKYGFFRLPLNTDNSLPPDRYTAFVKIKGKVFGITGFTITAGTPHRVSILSRMDKDLFFNKEKFKLEISAVYEDGEGVKNGRAEVEFEFDSFAYENRFFPEFKFNVDEEVSKYLLGAKSKDSVLSGRKEVVFDDSGKGVFSLELDGDFYSPRILKIKTTVRDFLGITGEKGSKATVMPSQVLVGLKAKSLFFSRDAAFEFKLITFSVPKHKIEFGRKVLLKLYRLDSRKGNKESYTFIEEKSVISADEPIVITWEVKEEGKYKVVAFASDDSGNTSASSLTFYKVGDRAYYPFISLCSFFKIKPDKKSYAPEEVARIKIFSPVKGVYAYIFVEREKIISVKKVFLNDFVSEHELKIKRSFFPGVYVTAVVFIPHEEEGDAKNSVSFGSDKFDKEYLGMTTEYLKVFVPRSGQALVKFKPGEDRGSTVVQVKSDRDGAVLFGVVKGNEESLPDFKKSVNDFFRDMPYRVPTLSNLKLNRGGYFINLGKANMPYSSFLSFYLDADFLKTGILKKDKWEKFKIPFLKNASEPKLLLFVIPEDESFFKIVKKVPLKNGLGLNTFCPEHVRTGDQFNLLIQVENSSKKEVTGKLQVIFSQELKTDEKTEKEVTVEQNGRLLVSYPVVASRKGRGRVIITLKIGRKSLTRVVYVNIDPVSAPLVNSLSGKNSGNSSFTVKIRNGVLKDTGEFDIFVSNSRVSSLIPLIARVINTPYTNTEQIISKLLVLVSVYNFEPAYEYLGIRDKEGMKRKILRLLHLLALQKGDDGGYKAGFCSDCSQSEPFISAYAFDVLKKVEEIGVEKVGLLPLAQFLREKLKKGLNLGNKLAENRVKAYILYVLSTYEDSSLSPVQEIMNSKYFDKEIALMLGGAFINREGDPEIIKKLLIPVLNRVIVQSDKAYLSLTEGEEMNLFFQQSNRRLTAFLMNLLMSIEPDHELLPKFANWLLEKETSPHPLNIFEDSFVIYTLVNYFLYREIRKEVDFLFKISLNDRIYLEELIQGKEVDLVSDSIPLFDFNYGENEVGIYHKGRGEYFFFANLKYYAKNGVPEQNIKKGFIVKRNIYELKSGKKTTLLKKGKVYLVELVVSTDSDRKYVVIKEEIPAGEEVILAGKGVKLQKFPMLYNKTFKGSVSYSDWLITFYVKGMKKGFYAFYYLIRAKYKGMFYASPTKIFEMYDPNVMGTGKLKVDVIE